MASEKREILNKNGPKSKQARKGFRPPSAMKGIGYFQKLIEEFFGNFLGELFGRIFLGGYLGRIFWEDFWKEFFGRNYLVEIRKELMFL